MALQTETFQYIMHHSLEKMYKEYMDIKTPNCSFDEWCNSTDGKIYLAELVLDDIDQIRGINIILNFRHK